MQWDRYLYLKMMSFESLVKSYATKDLLVNRTVIVLKCQSGLCDMTLKSILDQSVRVNDIAIETDHSELITPELRQIVSIHPFQTSLIREPSTNTDIIVLKNGIIYPYNAVYNFIQHHHGQK